MARKDDDRIGNLEASIERIERALAGLVDETAISAGEGAKRTITEDNYRQNGLEQDLKDDGGGKGKGKNDCRLILQEVTKKGHPKKGWFFPRCVGDCPKGQRCTLEAQKGRAGIIFYRCVCK